MFFTACEDLVPAVLIQIEEKHTECEEVTGLPLAVSLYSLLETGNTRETQLKLAKQTHY